MSTRRNDVVDGKVRAHFTTGPVRHEIALNAYHLSVDTRSYTQTRAGSGALSNIYNLVVNYANPSFAGVAQSRFDLDQTLQGVAASDTLSVAEGRVQATLGVRRQGLKQINVGTGVTQYDTAATTPAFALLFRPVPQLTLYGNYIQGLAPAPTPPLTAINNTAVFAPARSRQKEVGAKLALGPVDASVALFEITQPSGLTNPSTDVFSVDGNSAIAVSRPSCSATWGARST